MTSHYIYGNIPGTEDAEPQWSANSVASQCTDRRNARKGMGSLLLKVRANPLRNQSQASKQSS